MSNYRELESWNRAMELMTQCFSLAAQLERAPAVAQRLQAASLSVPAQIAAGCGSGSAAALAQAQGAIYEVETLLFAAIRLRLLQRDQIDPALGLTARITAQLTRQRQQSAPAPAPAPIDPPAPVADVPEPAAAMLDSLPRAGAKPTMHLDLPADASPELRAAFAAMHTSPTETIPDDEMLTDADW